MSNCIKSVGYVVGIFAALIVVLFYFMWILWFIVGVVAIGFLTWITGAKITITKGGKKIGYYRWNKFYPHDES